MPYEGAHTSSCTPVRDPCRGHGSLPHPQSILRSSCALGPAQASFCTSVRRAYAMGMHVSMRPSLILSNDVPTPMPTRGPSLILSQHVPVQVLLSLRGGPCLLLHPCVEGLRRGHGRGHAPLTDPQSACPRTGPPQPAGWPMPPSPPLCGGPTPWAWAWACAPH